MSSENSLPTRFVQRWLSISLTNLLIAISIGATLRYAFVSELLWFDFKNFLHAHSHVAMLGWVYLAFYAFFIHAFLKPNLKELRFYNRLFLLTQFSVLGMLFCFPIYGYALWSIFFSSLHVLLSYLFTWRFLKDLSKNPKPAPISLCLIKTAFFFMVLSTLALWVMGPIMVLGQRGSGWYHMAIQFYLHFQFNGWFIFGVLALFFKILETHSIPISVKDWQRFYAFLLSSCFLTYALAIAWANPEEVIFWVNSLGTEKK